MAILPFSLANGSVADATDVNTLLQALQAILDGGIVDANIAPSLRWGAARLSALQEEQVFIALPVAQALSATGVVGVPVPFVNSATSNLQIKDITIDGLVSGTTGSVAPSVSVVAGTISAGTFTATATIGLSTSLGNFTTGQRFSVTVSPQQAMPASATHLMLNVVTAQTGSQLYALNANVRFTRSLQ
jgi:hypothetical protein